MLAMGIGGNTHYLFLRMRNVELARAQEKLENVKEGEEIQRLRELHLWEQSVARQRQVEQKKSTMQAHLVRKTPFKFSK